MAVFTSVTREQLQNFLSDLRRGLHLLDFKGIEGGIENTNYFIDIHNDQGQKESYVLTIFERLSAEQLPFYLNLMAHLADKGLAVPRPIADPEGHLILSIANKPAALVSKLAGKSELAPQAPHCAQIGASLARLHLAGKDFLMQQSNLRGLSWSNEIAPLLLPFLTADQQQLLQEELVFQNEQRLSPAYQALPRGPIHADLFRDNVMFVNDRLSGLFDFYFAATDTWVFDVAVTLNDWCIDHSTGQWKRPSLAAFCEAYQSIRPFEPHEKEMINTLLRAAALRFWMSRLWDFYLPREANLLKPHCPQHFERVLQQRRQFSFPQELLS